MKKRIVSAAIALILCLTLLPTAALAEGAETFSKLNFVVSQPSGEANYTIIGCISADKKPDGREPSAKRI